MRLSREELKGLMKKKLMKAGLKEEHADITAEILTWSDERGYHSHGAVRVEYYSERIAKGGITTDPHFEFKKTGPCSGIFEGDNGCGYVAAKKAMEKAIEMAKENGIAVVGMRNISHSGSIGYYTEMAADQDLVAISFCQSDPMAVPPGGTEPYYGTNPISFAAPTADGRKVVFDMATTVQAWGKILDKRSRGESIPDTWAVDEKGNPSPIIEILKEKKVTGTFFIDGSWLEKNQNELVSLIEGKFTVGNYSYRGDYGHESFVWIDTIIKRVGGQKQSYCLVEKENKKALSTCKLQKDYTIYPNIIMKENPYSELTEQVESGSIILMRLDAQVKKELPLMITYLKQKGYEIVNLEQLLEE